MSYSRSIPPLNATANLQSAPNMTLDEKVRHHANLRIQQLFLDFVALYGKGSSSSQLQLTGAKVQGFRGSRDTHAAHNTHVAGVRSDVLAVARRKAKEGKLSDFNRRILMDTYGSLDGGRDGDTLLQAHEAANRHHCTLLPRWVNLSIDCVMERHLREGTRRRLELVLRGAMRPMEALRAEVDDIRAHFIQREIRYLKKVLCIGKIQALELRIEGILSNRLDWKKQGLDPRGEVYRSLKEIRQLQTKLYKIGTRLPTRVTTALRLLPRKAYASEAFIAKRIFRHLKRYGLGTESIKRRDSRDYYRLLAQGCRWSWEGTTSTGVDKLIPKTPNSQKTTARRMTRRAGVQTPDSRDALQLRTPLPSGDRNLISPNPPTRTRLSMRPQRLIK